MTVLKGTSIVEGEILDKEKLLEIKDDLDDLHKNVDHENIREEGLDNRLFQDGAHSFPLPKVSV